MTKTVGDNEKSNCTGCSACYAACPVDCIRMVPDVEGFLYPAIGESCISCGKCVKVCPQINHLSGAVETEQEVYAALSKSYSTWKKSASGGAFAEICKVWGNGTAVIYGAAWNSLKVNHIRVEYKNVDSVLCSKYVASDMRDCYRAVKKDVLNDRYVVFCGTPCQVAGLRSFLDCDYNRLLFVDLVCHGAGSPAVFSDCITLLERQFGKKVEAYRFRAKQKYFEARHIQQIKFTDQSCVFVEDDPYMQLFLSEKCLRRSCAENCKYRDANRQGDITLADYKGLYLDFPELRGAKYNYTALVFNTCKGLRIKLPLSDNLSLEKSSLESIRRDNPLFYRNNKKNTDRGFMEEYAKTRIKACRHATHAAVIKKRSLLKSLYITSPQWIRQLIYRYKTR